MGRSGVKVGWVDEVVLIMTMMMIILIDNNDNSRFSFGCMLYKLLKGHSPFRQHKTKVNQASITSLFPRHTHNIFSFGVNFIFS